MVVGYYEDMLNLIKDIKCFEVRETPYLLLNMDNPCQEKKGNEICHKN